jgi:Mn2+/Fe2+ NRAMP family transporter
MEASAADVADTLLPLAGDFAFFIFSLGIIGTGLLSLPVLAGSAAYAFGEAQGCVCGLENKPWEAVGFYSVIGASVLLGLGIGFSQIDPVQALFWSAVINGFVAVPIMACMMLVASRRDQMGRFTILYPGSNFRLGGNDSDGGSNWSYADFLIRAGNLPAGRPIDPLQQMPGLNI